jgi:hypothetical protein
MAQHIPTLPQALPLCPAASPTRASLVEGAETIVTPALTRRASRATGPEAPAAARIVCEGVLQSTNDCTASDVGAQPMSNVELGLDVSTNHIDGTGRQAMLGSVRNALDEHRHPIKDDHAVERKLPTWAIRVQNLKKELSLLTTEVASCFERIKGARADLEEQKSDLKIWWNDLAEMRRDHLEVKADYDAIHRQQDRMHDQLDDLVQLNEYMRPAIRDYYMATRAFTSKRKHAELELSPHDPEERPAKRLKVFRYRVRRQLPLVPQDPVLSALDYIGPSAL